MLNGIDISVDQGAIDFQAVKGSGAISWVHAKATEGITYADTAFRGYHDQAKGAGLPFGAYHFFRGNDDGDAQAQNFLAAIDGYSGQCLPMVDCEEGGLGGVDATTYLARLGAFLHAVDATLNGKRTLIYFGYSFWVNTLSGYSGFSGHPAWPAAYNDDATLDMSGTGWSSWTVWQFSDGIRKPPIPGISASVDRDRLDGDLLAPILR
jgi:lysozyme